MEARQIKADKFALVDSFINKQKGSDKAYTSEQCFKMFGVSDSGYYAWKMRNLDKNGVQAERKKKRNEIKEKMGQIIIARNGVIPGKRTFRVELFRRYNLTVNLKRIASLMKEMHLVASKPHKDAYKHQASHNHVCAAPDNAVNQDFFIGPRRVILTDITYLYYGPYRETFYLCVFRDAFTRENLGFAVDKSITLDLVKAAYDMMIELHGNELKKETDVYVHHDQGSQYLSTTFKELLSNDNFTQSVSARGNSQDNAPMESFFGRLKTSILDMVAMCITFEHAKNLVSGYINDYNTVHYQYDLAALTPEEFYYYCVTGVYPLDSYFGVPASAMMTGGDLQKIRRTYADNEAKKRRESSAEKRRLKRLIDPVKIIKRDQGLIKRMINKWKNSCEQAQTQISHLKNMLEKTDGALTFIKELSLSSYKKLADPLVWRNYEELNYVFEMNELF